MWRRREWTAVGVVGVLLVAALAYCATLAPPSEPDSGVAARIAAGVPEATIEAVAAGLRQSAPSIEIPVPTGSGQRVAIPMGSGEPTSLTLALAGAGELWPEALVAAMLRTPGKPGGTTIVGRVGADSTQPAVAQLLRRAAGRLDVELLALVRDDSVSATLRQQFLAALARPDSPEALEGLVTLALDAGVDPALRTGALTRLPRFGELPPERLDALLYLPFGGLDTVAAIALARGGRVCAPSLVLEAAERLARPERLPLGSADQVLELGLWAYSLEPNALPRAMATTEATYLVDFHDQHVRRAVADAIARHVSAHPEYADLPFERDRRLARDRAATAMAVAPTRVEDLAGRPDDEIDFSTAAFVAAGDLHEGTLEAFERLMILLEREVDGSRDPDVVIQLLRERLHGPTRRLHGVGTDGLASGLAAVMELHCGNCVGNSVLWIAVADRLGLPIRPAMMPGHAAVVWNEGGARRIIETTAGGAERPASRYRTLDPLAVADGVADEDILRPVSELALLASLASNRASDLLHGEWVDPPREYRRALEFARTAIALDPGQVFARVNFALAAAKLGGAPLREAHGLLDQVADGPDLVPHERLVLCRAYLECGVVARAHEMIAPVEDRFPKDERVIALRRALGR